MAAPRLSFSSRGGQQNGQQNLIWIAAGGLAILVGGLLLATITPLILPVAGSAEAQQVDNLFRFMLAIGGAIFLLVEGILVVSVVRFRAKPDDISDGPPIQGNTTLEFIWTLIPSIIVIVLTLYAFSVWTSIRSEKENEQVVDAQGQRFAWTFTYSVPTADFPPDVEVEQVLINAPDILREQVEQGAITLTSNQIHTWVGQPMRITLHTEDVNHAFWIPGMRVKQDLLAGRVTDVRFTPIEAGVYRIVCAELCGSGHGSMAGEVVNGELTGAWLIVHADEATFLNEFYYPEQRQILFPPADPAELGRLVIQNYPCSGCHRLDDLGWIGQQGPSLNGIGARTQRLAASGYGTMAEYIYNSIRHPGEYLAPGYGNGMLQFNDEPSEPNYMPEADLNAIVAYLLTQTES